jgi:hypothetical protein
VICWFSHRIISGRSFRKSCYNSAWEIFLQVALRSSQLWLSAYRLRMAGVQGARHTLLGYMLSLHFHNNTVPISVSIHPMSSSSTQGRQPHARCKCIVGSARCTQIMIVGFTTRPYSRSGHTGCTRSWTQVIGSKRGTQHLLPQIGWVVPSETIPSVHILNLCSTAALRCAASFPKLNYNVELPFLLPVELHG